MILALWTASTSSAIAQGGLEMRYIEIVLGSGLLFLLGAFIAAKSWFVLVAWIGAFFVMGGAISDQFLFMLFALAWILGGLVYAIKPRAGSNATGAPGRE